MLPSKAVLDGRLVLGRLSHQLGVPRHARHGASEFIVPIRVSAVLILTFEFAFDICNRR
jgi:hypothetical protein